MRCGGGDGNDGVFVGCGGMSVNEYSKVLSSKRSCVLDGASEDIDVGDGGNDESLSSVVAVVTVIVSARLRVTKQPLALG